MKLISISRTDGGVSIMRLLNDADINQVVNDTGLGVLSWKEISEASIPTDRTFRDAWKPDMSTDMPKAREIHRHRMRTARKPKMEVLDQTYLKADEAGDTLLKSQIATQKQALRDVTILPAIETATTAEQLKTVWPSILK